MRLAAISMIRDEADLIAPFLGHLASFFDIVFLLDQRSTDGSGEAMRSTCADRPDWSYEYMDFAGRHQKEVKTHFMRKAFERGADMVFLIDSDEFVAFPDKAALVDALSPHSDAAQPLGFRLTPCVPQSFADWCFDPNKPLWIRDLSDDSTPTGPEVKAVVPRALFERIPGMAVLQGNHGVVAPGQPATIPSLHIGAFYHLPIRSRQQFLQKVFLSAIANFSKANPMTTEAVHKRRLLEAIGERELTDDVMATIAAQYPPTGGIIWWPAPVDLAKRGFVLGRLETAIANLPLCDLPPPGPDRLLARSLAAFTLEDAEGGAGHIVYQPGIARFRPKAGKKAKPAQPSRKAAAHRRMKSLRKRLARLEAASPPRWHFYLTVAAAVAAVAALAVALGFRGAS